MSQQATEVKARLRALLAEASRAKTKRHNWLFTMALLFGLFMIGLIYDLLVGGLGFGGFMGGLLAFAGGCLSTAPVIALESHIAGRRNAALAEEFNEVFPKQSGAYDAALSLLKGAQSESKVEKDLIQALGEDVVLGEVSGGLLGALDGLKTAGAPPAPPKPSTKTAPPPQAPTPKAKPRPGFMPLDPYGAERGGADS